MGAGKHVPPCVRLPTHATESVGAEMMAKPLLGLLGVLLAALTVEFKDGVVGAALADVRGGLGISSDPAGTWLPSLFSSGQVIGMSIATFWAVTVSIRRCPSLRLRSRCKGNKGRATPHR